MSWMYNGIVICQLKGMYDEISKTAIRSKQNLSIDTLTDTDNIYKIRLLLDEIEKMSVNVEAFDDEDVLY